MKFRPVGILHIFVSCRECGDETMVYAPSATMQVAADRAAILNLVLEARPIEIERLASLLRRQEWLR